MKKIVFLLAFIFLASFVSGQNSVIKQFAKKTITSDYALAGSDSVIYVLQAQQDWSLQIKPVLGAGCDSIYTSVRVFVSNSDGANTQSTDLGTEWTEIRVNDNALYTTSLGDTLVTATATSAYKSWLVDKTSFANVRIKVKLLCLDNTNEDNIYYIAFVTKPDMVWNLGK
jgi:ABC-type maltose transport system permease subunit